MKFYSFPLLEFLQMINGVLSTSNAYIYECRNLTDLCLEGTLAPEIGNLLHIKSM